MAIPSSRLLLAGLLCGLPLIGADPCDVVLNASKKVPLTPVHLYMTETSVGRATPRESEMIYTGGANGPVYLKMNGKWQKSPISAAELTKTRDEAAESVKHSCRYLRDEAVNGEPASVYETHSDSDDVKIDSKMWISKSRNQPLRYEMDMDSGGKMGKSHQSVRYDYNAVTAPHLQ